MTNIPSEVADLAQELKTRVAGEVRFDPYSRAMYSTDASIYQIQPLGVVIPLDKEDVIATVELAHRNGVPVLPRGGGTSLAGQTVGRAIVMDMSKYMNRLLEVNAEEYWARVQPGIVLDGLNHLLRETGLFFPPDPATSNRSNVGGAIGNNSCGSHSILYGKTVDHVKELEVVLSSGEAIAIGPLSAADLGARLRAEGQEGQIYRDIKAIVEGNASEVESRYPKILRRVGGYNLDELLKDQPFNLAKLIVGSEGTLASVTEAKLNLVPRPKVTALMVAHFYDLNEAMEATVATLEHRPSAVELMGRLILDQMRLSVGYARRRSFLEGDPEAVLLVEASGDTEEEVVARLEGIEASMRRQGMGYAYVRITGREEQANVWEVRRAGIGLMMGISGDAKPIPFIEDCSVSPEKLPEYIRRVDELIRAHGTTAAYYGHASVGCIHVRPFINLKQQADIDRMYSISRDACGLVMEMGGAMSGEHGDGLVRSLWNERFFGTQLYNAFREVKRAFDPRGIMNPGKIVDSPSMVENLRYGPSYRSLTPQTKLDFSREGGFHRAVEMCNGVGACRNTLSGVMCPSYMATREEEHSTRGRANALRAALSGLLPAEELASDRMHQVLDLCLECKGCKAECPSQVDMAKLKYEFLDAYHSKHGYPLRARLFANIAALSKIGSALAPLSNWGARFPVTRWALDRFLRIDRRRPLPPFTRRTFNRWFHSRKKATDGDIQGHVVLFNDTFMSYSYPSIGVAATELLERAGFRVTLVDRKCCGRPMVSKGMLDQAKAHAQYNVDLLYPYVEQGAYVVGCEPSCLLTLRDEYPDLLGTDKAKRVAESALMLEELLQMLQQRGELKLAFKTTSRKVLFHGHCHERALVGNAPALEALRLVPGLQVQESQAGCCGMAGAFGYEKEHYDISMTIGGQRLFPAVASAGLDTEIVVTGVSCRQQILHGTGRHPKHLAEVLAEALA
ncbi:MAG: anaerobic glycerol-3-phosphate dehydrogenase subunit C [Chloroflexi bacterium]|nr:anaerobic glycerol-3-phosphate dehydrogenase subunit C [Chloroflexota bacterium]